MVDRSTIHVIFWDGSGSLSQQQLNCKPSADVGAQVVVGSGDVEGVGMRAEGDSMDPLLGKVQDALEHLRLTPLLAALAGHLVHFHSRAPARLQ